MLCSCARLAGGDGVLFATATRRVDAQTVLVRLSLDDSLFGLAGCSLEVQPPKTLPKTGVGRACTIPMVCPTWRAGAIRAPTKKSFSLNSSPHRSLTTTTLK